jgi:hypothetical protein
MRTIITVTDDQGAVREARSPGCDAWAPDSGIERQDARRFRERNVLSSFCFKRALQ